MKRIGIILCLSLTICLLAGSLQAQDLFQRMIEIPAEELDVGGFGNLVPGIDIDGDGLLEIYAVNNDWFDVPGSDLVPRIYKYEEGGLTGWQIVWSTPLDFFFQNTWPALEYADLDKDGRMEIVWGPVNNSGGGTNINPPRIVVFESLGDGSDQMGIDNGDGTFRPNAFTTIETDSLIFTENRPIKFIITDIDSDNTDEIVSVSRNGAERGQIFSVDNVPDNGDSSEVWTLEFSGTGANTHYDGAVVGPKAYFVRDGGDVDQVTWDGQAYVERDSVHKQAVPNGSWKSAAVVDIDGDDTKEVLVASWSSATSNVYLVQQDNDTLKTTLIMDVPDVSNRLYGGDAGDVDNDGNLDYIFGTRQSTPNGLIYRLEYQGGAIDDPANYVLSTIDSLVANATQYDEVFVANMDDDPEDEIIYSGTARGAASGDPQPIVILDFAGVTSVEEDAFTPSDFTLHANYPNPFNPETRIAYDLEKQTDVALKVYNLRGQVVRNLVNQTQVAGSYTEIWNGRNDAGISVPSGVYFYAFKAGDFTQTRRMTLLK